MRKRQTTERPVLHAPAPPSPAELERMERERGERAREQEPERGVAVVDFYV